MLHLFGGRQSGFGFLGCSYLNLLVFFVNFVDKYFFLDLIAGFSGN